MSAVICRLLLIHCTDFRVDLLNLTQPLPSTVCSVVFLHINLAVLMSQFVVAGGALLFCLRGSEEEGELLFVAYTQMCIITG